MRHRQPSRHIRRRQLTAAAAGTTLLVGVPGLLAATSAQATPTGPGVQPGHNITVVANLDFVSVTGYDPAYTPVVVEVVRRDPATGEDVVVGRAIAPSEPTESGANGVELNHGTELGDPLGRCWDTQTPDIRAGDRIVVTSNGATDEVTVDDIRFVGRPYEDPATGDVLVDGIARRADGTPIPASSLDSGEFRNTTGKYRIAPDVVETAGPDGEFRVRYRKPFTGERNRENLDEAQRKAALLEQDGHAIGFGHVDPLPAESMLVDGLTDASGPAAGCESSPAGNAPLPPRETTPPTVTQQTPADGATDVDPFTAVTATFSEDVSGVDAFTFRLIGPDGEPVPNDVWYDATTRVATLYQFGLEPGITYTAELRDGVSDAVGNGLAPVRWSFTTSLPADTQPPTVVSRSPLAGATAVSRQTNVTATFDEPVTGVTGTTLTLRNGAGTLIPAAVHYDAATQTATLDPTNSLAAGTRYTARLTAGVADEAGNPLTATSWTFTTAAAADTVRPTITARTPAPGAIGVRRGVNVTATFSEPVTGVNGTTVTLRTGTGVRVQAVVRYSATTRMATLDPTTTLQPRTRYTVALTNGIADAAGNRLAATTWSFTTGGS